MIVHADPTILKNSTGQRVSLIAKLSFLAPNGLDGKLILCDKSEISGRFQIPFEVSCSGLLYIEGKVESVGRLNVEKVIELPSDDFGIVLLTLDMDFYHEAVLCAKTHNTFFS
ncbi:hypothetical protein RF11_12727 [Thelohanellus kitauei]|uniref:Uncharacterized protein n=1 Tax=Thelohanellus kitauei TaxID=669202 RepID=A0A0C2MJU1_THEKT|nr:hypothetical protein RF11_12727 [Thelohanellus kitauei]